MPNQFLHRDVPHNGDVRIGCRGRGSFCEDAQRAGVPSLTYSRGEGLAVAYDGTYWTLTYNGGEKRIFNAAGQLLSMRDRNGNTTQLTYDASNRLATVTDPASRHLYFSYASPSSNLVVGVSHSHPTVLRLWTGTHFCHWHLCHTGKIARARVWNHLSSIR
jgi:YD repeat-containing protein